MPGHSALDPRSRRVKLFIALLWGIGALAATVQQGVLHQTNNFQIFRAASLHLLHGQDLYVAYPALHFDFYKYSPTFAFLFLPFALSPFWLSLFLWNLLGAGALYFALGAVLPPRVASVGRAIVFLDMFGSLQNMQSNALVAALIIYAFVAFERRHPVRGSLATAVGASIKIFPLASASFAIFHPRKARIVAALAMSAIVLVLLPLCVTAPSVFVAQYASWRAIEAKDAFDRGLSVMQMLQLLLQRDWPNWPIQSFGVVALLAPVLVRRQRWTDEGFRRLYLCSVLVFCVIFNHQSESPTFVIAVAGAAIWFASLPRRTPWEWALFTLVVVGTMLASTDVIPGAVRRAFFLPYHVKVVPCIVLWVELQRQLWRRGPAKSVFAAEAR